MAVRLEGSIKRFIGLSTDEKPNLGYQWEDGSTIVSADLPAGSSFMESDTGDIYRWTGSEWAVPDDPEDRQLLALQAMLFQLTALRESFELFVAANTKPATA